MCRNPHLRPGLNAVDKPARNVRAYDREGKLLAYYPATMGSEEKPATSGVFKVKGVTWNPEYHYDPKFAWKEVKIKQRLTVRPVEIASTCMFPAPMAR